MPKLPAPAAPASTEDQPDPLTPSPSLLITLGSIIVHFEEFLEPGGHPLDHQTAAQLLQQPEVIQWRQQMKQMAMLPLKRSEK